MDRSESLIFRANAIVQVGAVSSLAKVRVDQALALARDAHADLAVIQSLEHAAESLNRAIKRAEVQRLRLLRKVDRLETKA